MAVGRGIQAPSRLKLEGVVCDAGALVTRARVRLSLNGVERMGMASGLSGEAPWQRIVAEAALDAIQGFTGRLEAAVDSVKETMAGGLTLIVVTMVMREPNNATSMFLVGVSHLDGDEPTTIAKAVLDALNRRVAPLLP
jgi:hypothetical protein